MKEVGEGLPWLGFWLFMSVVWYCDYRMYMAGHDTFFFSHKTEQEKAIRDRITGYEPEANSDRPEPPKDQ